MFHRSIVADLTEQREKNMADEIKIGVIGFGWMGQAHARSYRRLPTLFPDLTAKPRLVAVCDTDPERLSVATDQFGFEHGHVDWKDLIARDDVDVVDVTAPNGMHEMLTVAALEAGKHVFCEKPVGIDPFATARIAASARKAGLVTGAGYNYRWAPMVQYSKSLIDDGRLGEPTHYRGRFFSMYGRDRLGPLSWRYQLDKAGYGALTDIMSHTIDMALHLYGPISRLVSTKETFVKNRPLPQPGSKTHYDRGNPNDPTGEVTNEDYVGALVQFANGARGTLESDRSIFGPQSQIAFELNGSKGASYWDHEKLNQLQLYLPEETPVDGFVEVLSGEGFAHHGNFVPGAGNSIGYEDLKTIEAYEFLKAVGEGQVFHPNFDDALRVAEVQAAMIRSWQSETWENVTEISQTED